MRAGKRLFDLVLALFGLLLLWPLLLLLAVLVRLADGGPAFFRQERVGFRGRPFRIWKLRTMSVDAPKRGAAITVGEDPRITRVGRVLRRLKLDELPQLVNVVAGQMSFVGPRPEVPHYVALYDAGQRSVLELMPGITDPASVAYVDEATVLAAESDPEWAYRERVMPHKIQLNLEYARRASLGTDLRVLFGTLGALFRGHTLVAASILLAGVSCASATEIPGIYVAPEGKVDARGTRDDPLSLLGASQREVPPGTTFYLRGGRYLVPAETTPRLTWKGVPENRIVLRSLPGEWAVIDGKLIVDGDARYVTLREFEVTRKADETPRDPGWWRLPVQERPPEAEFRQGGSLIDVLESRGVELVNLYLHDNVSGGGLGLWNPAQDTLVYGCIIVRNGFDDRTRGHGHGAYVQNGYPEERAGSVKRLRHNVTAYNHSTGMKSYASAPSVLHTYFEGNVFFGNGLSSWTNGSPNYLAGTASGLLDDIVLDGNHFYQPDSVTGDVGGTIALGWGGPNKGTCVFTDNHVAGGGSSALWAQAWRKLTFTGNTLFDDKQILEVSAAEPHAKDWTWDANTYFGNRQPAPLAGRTFVGWKERFNFDRSSTWIAERPTGNWVFVLPNEYEPSRALLVIYNWDHANSADVDLSAFLKTGRHFGIWNSLDYRGAAVVSGTYTGGAVRIPLVGDGPVGNEFLVFVVDAGRAGPSAQP